jgi:hypothetical protein
LSLIEARDPSPAPAPTPAPEPSGVERRASVRVEPEDLATLINGTPVRVVDLSVTGAQIVSPLVLRLGESVHVMLTRDDDVIECAAGIVWGGFEITQSTLVPSFRAGINFRDADRFAIERICVVPPQTGLVRARPATKDW